MEVFSSKEARDEGKKPIGAIGINPTEVQSADVNSVSDPKDFKIHFYIDPNSTDSVLSQAYAHLKKSDYYKDALED